MSIPPATSASYWLTRYPASAGYGLVGEFESFSEEQIRRQMVRETCTVFAYLQSNRGYTQEVNFFGLVDVTRKAIETMRDLKTGGVIQQVTSIGGQRGVPTFSIYCASKWAVEVCCVEFLIIAEAGLIRFI